MFRTPFAIGVLLLTACTATAQIIQVPIPPLPADLVRELDMPYRTVGKVTRELDVYRPKNGPKPFPAVILLHGVGTGTKGRRGQHTLAIDLAQQGFVAVAVSYNHEPNGKTGEFLDPIHDVKAAVRWLRSEGAKKFDIDPEKIGVVGFSAGACLACLLGMTRPNDGLEGAAPPNAQPTNVQAVVGYFPPSDFRSLHATWKMPLPLLDWENARRPFLIKNLEGWFGGTPMACADRYDKLSPIKYVRKDTAPLLLLHGKLDRVIPHAHSEQLEKKLRELNAPVTLKLFDKAGHDFDEEKSEHAREAAKLTIQFLVKHLLKR